MNFDHFYSDPHFGHENVIEFCDRPFKDVHHQTMSLMARYNLCVGPDQTVLWLGDCFLRHTDDEMRQVLEQLNGKKVLVKGNHDRPARRMCQVGFEFVTQQLVWQQRGQTFRGSHFPWRDMFSNEGRADGGFEHRHPRRSPLELLVHGHTHSSEPHTKGNAIHVGCDAWDYAPVSIRDVVGVAKKHGVWDGD